MPFALISAFLLQRPLSPLSICGFSALFSLTELSFTLLPCGFPFLSSALYFAGNPLSLQLASLLGEAGLSFLVFATNLSFLLTFQQKRWSFLLLLILLPYLAGGLCLWKRSHEKNLFDQTLPPLRVAILHTNDGPDVFDHPVPPEALVSKSWNNVFSLLSSLTPGSLDLLVLPEGAISYPAEAPLFPTDKLPAYLTPLPYPSLTSLEITTLLSQYLNTPILIGLEGRSYKEGKPVSYNSCYFVSKGRIARYDKQLLLPFGEYIPSDNFRKILAAYGVHGSFAPGKGPVLFPGGITPSICYEEIFSFYTKKALTLNPTLFVNISSDTWFPCQMLAKEHFILARLRAVEAGKPLIRSCNMGISGTIDALGALDAESPISPTCLKATLSRYHYHSFALQFDGWEKILLLSFVGLLLSWRKIKTSI